MINPRFDERDDKACGLFRPVPSGRVYRGNDSYVGQFPWTVCFIRGVGTWIKEYGSDPSNAVKQSSTTLPPDTIFDLGPYEFSMMKGTIYTEKVEGWASFCTGSIINEKWIITAAHCMMNLWEANNFFIQAGSNECVLNKWNEYTREVVVNRMNNHDHRTVWEHPNWIQARAVKYPYGHDIALVRLDDHYILPKGVYNKEPINRICLYSNVDLPRSGCLKNVYFSGFGLKFSRTTIKQDVIDPTVKLTWFKLFRTSKSHCEIISGKDMYSQGAACYSQVLSQFDLGETPTKTQLGIDNEAAARSMPNTCPGDSGGPFAYYMKYDKSQPDPHNVLSDGSIKEGYRAILLSTLFGSSTVTPTVNNCDMRFWQEKKSFSLFSVNQPLWFKPIHVGPQIYVNVNTTFFSRALSSNADGHDNIRGSDMKYPNFVPKD